MKHGSLTLGQLEALLNIIGRAYGASTKDSVLGLLSGDYKFQMVRKTPWQVIEVDGEELELALVRVDQLGASIGDGDYGSEPMLSIVYDRARELGLMLCPPGTAQAVLERGNLDTRNTWECDRELRFASDCRYHGDTLTRETRKMEFDTVGSFENDVHSGHCTVSEKAFFVFVRNRRQL
ncbi:hypothetical protein GF380_05395 [Candidatus Uhrbacteria bacterium]|nr:hypothetical protein [Candidatus Uhrbacteria bacterium]MBD3284465.1 hypothetical protein [Candidatus Uhrbacteria bacterium]